MIELYHFLAVFRFSSPRSCAMAFLESIYNSALGHWTQLTKVRRDHGLAEWFLRKRVTILCTILRYCELPWGVGSKVSSLVEDAEETILESSG